MASRFLSRFFARTRKPKDGREAWLRWYLEADDALTAAVAHEARMWLDEQSLSEGMREAIEATRQARQRWEERLTAYNAFQEAQR